jgi:hypothetical protein
MRGTGFCFTDRAIKQVAQAQGNRKDYWENFPLKFLNCKGWADFQSFDGSRQPCDRVDRDGIALPQRGFFTASTSISPFPLENTGLLIVPPIRKGNCNLPSFNAAPENRATVLVKKLCFEVISAKPR